MQKRRKMLHMKDRFEPPAKMLEPIMLLVDDLEFISKLVSQVRIAQRDERGPSGQLPRDRIVFDPTN